MSSQHDCRLCSARMETLGAVVFCSLVTVYATAAVEDVHKLLCKILENPPETMNDIPVI